MIFEKPMIQVHGKTILLMKFKSIIKTHDLNPCQFIYPKPNSHWQYQSLILIGNIKTQFSLTTSNLNSHWQYQKPSSHWQYPKPNFHWHYFIKKGAQDYQRLAKKKHHGKILA